MTLLRAFFANILVGVPWVVPIYLAVLLLLQGMRVVGGLVRPFAVLLPA
jgi:TM2 domain-containing membrane protein YozV